MNIDGGASHAEALHDRPADARQVNLGDLIRKLNLGTSGPGVGRAEYQSAVDLNFRELANAAFVLVDRGVLQVKGVTRLDPVSNDSNLTEMHVRLALAAALPNFDPESSQTFNSFIRTAARFSLWAPIEQLQAAANSPLESRRASDPNQILGAKEFEAARQFVSVNQGRSTKLPEIFLLSQRDSLKPSEIASHIDLSEMAVRKGLDKIRELLLSREDSAQPHDNLPDQGIHSVQHPSLFACAHESARVPYRFRQFITRLEAGGVSAQEYANELPKLMPYLLREYNARIVSSVVAKIAEGFPSEDAETVRNNAQYGLRTALETFDCSKMQLLPHLCRYVHTGAWGRGRDLNSLPLEDQSEFHGKKELELVRVALSARSATRADTFVSFYGEGLSAIEIAERDGRVKPGAVYQRLAAARAQLCDDSEAELREAAETGRTDKTAAGIRTSSSLVLPDPENTIDRIVANHSHLSAAIREGLNLFVGINTKIAERVAALRKLASRNSSAE